METRKPLLLTKNTGNVNKVNIKPDVNILRTIDQ